VLLKYNQIKFTLQFKIWYFIDTMTKTTNTKHAAGNNITFGEYSNNFIEVYNVRGKEMAYYT